MKKELTNERFERQEIDSKLLGLRPENEEVQHMPRRNGDLQLQRSWVVLGGKWGMWQVATHAVNRRGI